jgi:ABC-type multidrug transport system ATPase subunit
VGGGDAGVGKAVRVQLAVNGVDLLIPRGCAFGYLGPNGADKTTLIRVLLGLTHADAGTMSLLGHSVPAHRDKALARVGAIVDEPRFHGHLTGRQNLQVLAAAREPAARGRIDASLERVGVLQRADDRVSKYSMGMRQRLGVAACLIGDPEMLILDEPMNGLDPAGMHDMRDMIRSLVAEGRTVVLSSHTARRGAANLRRGGHRGPGKRHPARPDRLHIPNVPTLTPRPKTFPIEESGLPSARSRCRWLGDGTWAAGKSARSPPLVERAGG